MAASNIPYPLRARLSKDLSELKDLPYPGVAVFTNDADIRKLCLILTPPSGPWKDLSLHFDVVLPENWPMYPPTIKSSVNGIQHPNLFGDYICCDLLKRRDQYRTEYTGGYSPALTLRGLFLQFLTFFSSTHVEQDYGGTVYIGDYLVYQYMTEEHLTTQNRTGSQVESWSQLSRQEQISMEQQWAACDVAETDITTYELHKEVEMHCVKTVEGGARIHRLSVVNPRWKATYKVISQWQCKKCPYGSESLPAHCQVQKNSESQDQIMTNLVPPPACLLGMLNDDILLALSTYMLSESVVDFSIAYPRFQRLITLTRELLQRELCCFLLRTSTRETVIGIGVALDPKSRRLSSDFDWLSKQAFDQFDVKTSIQKRGFEFFLPLAFSRSHFERAQKDIWLHLQCLDEAVRMAESAVVQRIAQRADNKTSKTLTAPRKTHELVGVVYRMMNNIVVSLMKSCDHVLDASFARPNHSSPTLLHASEKAVVSYCHLFHLLLSLTRTTPAILHDATQCLRRFIMIPGGRSKAEFPDLGELIILINLVLACPPIDEAKPITWQMLNGPFLEEAMTRNVRWILADSPELEVLEEGASEYRLQKTFLKSRTSLRLIMFQIAFLDIFVKTYAGVGVKRLDENYGFPEADIPERIVKEVKAIYEVVTWPGFFQRVRYARGLAFDQEKMSELLRAAVRKSSQKGYHTATPPAEMHIREQSREILEKQSIEAKT